MRFAWSTTPLRILSHSNLLGDPVWMGPAYQGRSEAFNVLLVRADGTLTIFPSYGLVKGT